jgi:hypothetical protein
VLLAAHISVGVTKPLIGGGVVLLLCGYRAYGAAKGMLNPFY